jgi:hypothetical protein
MTGGRKARQTRKSLPGQWTATPDRIAVHSSMPASPPIAMQPNPYQSPVHGSGPNSEPPGKRFLENHFGRIQLLALLVVWVCFTVLTCLIAEGGIDRQPDHNRLVFWTTFSTPLGPMTGAISRRCQSCCLANSLALLPYCGTFLAMGTICQFFNLPIRRGAGAIRMTLWVLGLLGWFLGGPISFLHALN